MQTNNKVEAVVEKLVELVPDFKVYDLYKSAIEIVEIVETTENANINEPTA